MQLCACVVVALRFLLLLLLCYGYRCWLLLLVCPQGYAPISIRLVEAALKGGWAPVAEVLSMLPGGQFDSLQVL